MKIRLSVLFFLIVGLCCLPLRAEKEKEPEFKTEHHNWKLAGMVSGSMNVIQFSDWQAGGSDTVTINGRGEFWAVRSTERFEWKNRLRSEFGVSKTNGESFRNSTDSLKLDSRFERKFNAKAKAYCRGYLETHFVKQYVYFDSRKDIILDDDKVYTNVEKFRISQGFDPIKLEQGLGMGYTLYRTEDKSTEITIMSGLGARQLITDSYRIAEDIDTTPAIEFYTVKDDSEFGIEVVLDTLVTLNKHTKIYIFCCFVLRTR